MKLSTGETVMPNKSKPVRIKSSLMAEIEKEAIRESAKEGHLLALADMVEKLLLEALSHRGVDDGKSLK